MCFGTDCLSKAKSSMSEKTGSICAVRRWICSVVSIKQKKTLNCCMSSSRGRMEINL